MPAARKFDNETRARAVRMYTDRLRDHDESKLAARRAVGAMLDIKQDTLRNWIEREEVDTGVRPGLSSQESAEVKALRKENAELRRANEILKTASAFLAQAELDCGGADSHLDNITEPEPPKVVVLTTFDLDEYCAQPG